MRSPRYILTKIIISNDVIGSLSSFFDRIKNKDEETANIILTDQAPSLGTSYCQNYHVLRVYYFQLINHASWQSGKMVTLVKKQVFVQEPNKKMVLFDLMVYFIFPLRGCRLEPSRR